MDPATPPLTLCLPCPTYRKVSGAASLPLGGGSLEVPQDSDRAPGLEVFTAWQPSRWGGKPTAGGMHGWSSYQLLASRLLGWGLSGPLSCFVAKGAQVPSRRRTPLTGPGPGMSLSRWGSRSPHRAPSHLWFQAGVQDDPGPSAVLPRICSAAPHPSYLRGD